MSPLSAHARALLVEARLASSPTPAELRRVRSRLTAGLLAAGGSLAFALPLSALLGAALAAAALVAFGASSRPPPPPPPAAVVSVASCPKAPACPAPAPAPLEPESPAAAPPKGPAPRRAPAPPSLPKGPAPQLRPRSVGAELFSVAAEPVDRADSEVSLLADARVALDERRLYDALGHVQRHAQLFPASAFTEERLALQLLIDCALRRFDLAEPLFQELLELSPDSTYLPRVRGSCPGLAEGGSGADDE